ncbi:hypothetical protein BA190_14490 [Labrys sp. WJW]|nr:hypothetical protein BA190_14490 [Labrys sp. WJW]
MIEMFKPSRVAGLAVALATLFGAAGLSQPAWAEGGEQPTRQQWSFAGPFGRYDQGQLQRGFKVYREVCSACHSLHRVAFRTLADPGGPGFTEGQVKALAAEYTVMDVPNDKGEVLERKGRPADYFPLVYPNDQAAAVANNGAIPPDMSLLAKARGVKSGFPGFVFDIFTQYQEQGPDYIHALITDGYLKDDEKPPEGVTVPPNGHYNKIFGASIGMAKPLADGQVEYTDGAPQTVDQYTRDVAAFLAWAADPSLEKRKQTGFVVIIFLIVLSGLLYYTKKKIWADAH